MRGYRNWTIQAYNTKSKTTSYGEVMEISNVLIKRIRASGEGEAIRKARDIINREHYIVIEVE